MFALRIARSTVYFEQGAGENKIWEWSEVFWILKQKLKQNKWQKKLTYTIHIVIHQSKILLQLKQTHSFSIINIYPKDFKRVSWYYISFGHILYD